MSIEDTCQHRLDMLRPVVHQVSDWGSDSGGAFGSIHWVRVGDAAIEAAAVAEEAAVDAAIVHAKQGDPIAARSVGLRLMEGSSQHGHSAEAAAEAWSEGAEANDPESMNNLGVLYQKGTKGKPANLSLAFYYFNKSAALGHPGALHSLAVCYWNGYGVDANHRLSREYYTKAATLGDPYAALQMAQFYRTGQGVGRDLFKARAYLKTAVTSGDPIAMLYVLGMCSMLQRFFSYVSGTWRSCFKPVKAGLLKCAGQWLFYLNFESCCLYLSKSIFYTFSQSE
jgi:TPR repeat protein